MSLYSKQGFFRRVWYFTLGKAARQMPTSVMSMRQLSSVQEESLTMLLWHTPHTGCFKQTHLIKVGPACMQLKLSHYVPCMQMMTAVHAHNCCQLGHSRQKVFCLKWMYGPDMHATVLRIVVHTQNSRIGGEAWCCARMGDTASQDCTTSLY